jgi:hypothetical protein
VTALLQKFSLVEVSRLQPDDRGRLADISIPRAGDWADYFAKEVQHGGARLSHVQHAGRTIGTVLWRIESDVERELVVMSVASSDPKTSITAFLARAVDAIAAAEKCESARFHTIRPGLVKFAHGHGWHTSEIVLRKSYHVA